MITYKDFIKELCKKNSMNTTLVTFIIESFMEWVKSNLLACTGVQISFGRFLVTENKYKGLKSLVTMNKYRVSFSAARNFKEEMKRAKKRDSEKVSLFDDDTYTGEYLSKEADNEEDDDEDKD